MTADLDIHLAAIVSGDAHAFARWLAGSEPTVRATLRSFAAVVDVEAVLQEALLRVWQVAPRFVADGEPNGLLRLGIRIARNLAVSELRRTQARPATPSELEDALPEVRPSEPDPMLRRAITECGPTYTRLPIFTGLRSIGLPWSVASMLSCVYT